MRGVAGLAIALCLFPGSGPPGWRSDPQAQNRGADESVAQLLDRYAGGEHVLPVGFKTRADLERFRDRLTRDADAWIRAAGAAVVRRRQLVAATVALEVARASIDLEWDEGRRLVEWGSELLRKSAADDAERLWHLAALSLIQGQVDYKLLVNQKDHAWTRFPNEPRFLLALVVMLEGDTWPEPDRGQPWDADEQSLERASKMAQARRNSKISVTVDIRAKAAEHQRRTSMRTVMTLLEDLSNASEIRADALLRLGLVHLRFRHPEVAREQFEDVLRLSTEPFLVYLAWFFTGVTHEEENERAEAIAAYRAALAAVPRAQSASFALASLLFVSGDRDEASRIIDAAIAPPAVDDPWRGYQTGDFRLWPERIAVLRGALR